MSHLTDERVRPPVVPHEEQPPRFRRPRRPTARTPFRWFAPALALLLGGYLFFGKTFAYLHLPGTPLYVGELVLGIGVLEVLDLHSPWRRLLRVSWALRVALCFVAVCAVRLGRDVGTYGIDAIRDSSVWYYCAFAFLVAAAVVRNPAVFPCLLRWYRRAIPPFLLWAPVAVVLANLPQLSGLQIPGTGLPLNAFKPGDIAVSAAMAVAFLWLAPDRQSASVDVRRSGTVLLSCLGLVVLLVCGSQTRGGLLAGAGTLLAAAVCLPAGHRRRLGFSIGAALLAALVTVAALDVRIDGLRRDREISLEQVVDNVTSLVDRSSSADLDGTVAWRDRLWDRAHDDLVSSGALFTGLGFGPALGIRYGVSRPENPAPLRSVHNSHLGILVRAGAIAAGLWVLMWTLWGAALLALLGRSRRGVRDPTTALGVWLLASAMGIAVNAYFDPSLETPQVAVWMYVVFGLGAVVARYRPDDA